MKSTLIGAKKSKMGRPPVESEAVNVRMALEAIETIDNWRREQADLPGRPEAVRRLVELGLKAKAAGEAAAFFSGNSEDVAETIKQRLGNDRAYGVMLALDAIVAKPKRRGAVKAKAPK
jgi:hypothetical protein